jgi:hypothetical protein
MNAESRVVLPTPLSPTKITLRTGVLTSGAIASGMEKCFRLSSSQGCHFCGSFTNVRLFDGWVDDMSLKTSSCAVTISEKHNCGNDRLLSKLAAGPEKPVKSMTARSETAAK